MPYNVVSKLEPAVDASPDVNANDGQVQKHDETVMPTIKGDQPGTAKGVVSGTVGEQSWSQEPRFGEGWVSAPLPRAGRSG